MKKNKKLLTRMMASVMTGMLLFGQVSPVFAQDTEESAAAADDESEKGKLEFISVDGKEVPSFTSSDGITYYPSQIALDSLEDVNRSKLPIDVMWNKTICFPGWDDYHIQLHSNNTLASTWLRLGTVMQLNSGLVTIPANDGLSQSRIGGAYGYRSLQQTEENMLDNWNCSEFKKALSNEKKEQYAVGIGYGYYQRGRDTPDMGHVAAYFYNFRYTPMLTDEYLKWAVDNKVAAVEDNVNISKEAGLGCYNDTPLPKTDSQHVEKDESQSCTKGNNGSWGGSFSYTTKMSIQGDGGVLKIGTELGYTASVAFSRGWSQSESTTHSSKTGSNQTITLKPYSGVNLENLKKDGTYKQTIDFPLILSYDVKLVSYGMTESNGKPGKDQKTVIMATYEGRNGSLTRTDAQSDLYQRYFKNQEDQGVKYKGDAYPFDVDGLISCCGKAAPFVTAKKTSFDGKVNDRVSKAGDFIALHPLRSVDTTKEMRSLSMKPGTVYQGRDIPIFGYLAKQYTDGDGKTAKYSTFNSDRGHWELKSGKGIIEITLDDQKRQQIKALKEGEATIIYRIDENVYNSNENRAKFATNDALEATAEMTVTVSKTAAEDTSGFINQALHALENDGTGWTVDDGYILGSEDGEALTDAAVSVSGLEGIQLEAKGNTLDSRDGLESVQYNLTGENADTYDVYYRSYVKDLGWMNWASNDQLSGTSGYDKEITAVQVMILEKDITPTADDSVTLGFFMENTDNSDPAVVFALIKQAHEEYAKPAKSVITYSTDSTDEDSESNDGKATDSTDAGEGKNSDKEEDLGDKTNDFFDSIGDMVSNLFNPGSEEN